MAGFAGGREAAEAEGEDAAVVVVVVVKVVTGAVGGDVSHLVTPEGEVLIGYRHLTLPLPSIPFIYHHHP